MNHHLLLFARAVVACAASLCAAALAACNSSPSDKPAVAFNQHWLERRWLQQIPSKAAVRPGIAPEIALDTFQDADAVLMRVLLATPKHSVVYPSEQYYYYQFWQEARLISGNLRFVNAPEKLWVGYFDRNDSASSNARAYGAADGLAMTMADVRGGRECTVAWRGVQRTFFLPATKPRPTSHFPLLADERIVSCTMDESGTGLVLLYEPGPKAFAFALDPSAPAAEEYQEFEIRGRSFRVGEESRWIFLKDQGRWILVGVSEEEVQRNTYFDGPFDQIPPDLDIKEMIELVYPYVREVGGVDANGNFLTLEHQRVAISPYQQYTESPRQFCERAALLLDEQPDIGWLLMTWESKRVFHRELERRRGALYPEGYRHDLELSKQWPAGHFPSQSLKSAAENERKK